MKPAAVVISLPFPTMQSQYTSSKTGVYNRFPQNCPKDVNGFPSEKYVKEYSMKVYAEAAKIERSCTGGE